jgi:PE family
MSFVTAAPEEVQAAARNLEGIRSMLAQSSASAAAPTAGVVAAAEDQVSAQVAAFFGAFGQEYQVISAQAQAFHEQFVNLVSAGAGAYLSTELANAQQNLLNAVTAPVLESLGRSAAASGGAVGAAAAGLTAARSAVLPLLGGVGSIIGSGAPIGQSINGAVAALQNGSAASLLSGPIGAGGTPLSGLATGLLVFAPEQLALAITPAG